LLYIFNDMERLIKKSERKVSGVKSTHKRYLCAEINWEDRLILLLGHRGTGKTTLLLQHLYSKKNGSIYLSLDDLYFETNRLIYVVEELYERGYRSFYLDEVHRYFNWSKDLKQLYDDYDDIHIVATGSSILDLSKGTADLSRRAIVYTIQGLSFREYLLFEQDIHLPPISLDDVITHHQEISTDYLDQFSWEKDFKNYLNYGYYPFFLEGKQSYFSKVSQMTNLVIDTDIAPFEELNYSTVRTLKKLLFVISESAPFKPNISKLSERLETPRNTLLRLIDLLSKAKIINLLRTETKGGSYLQKPEKIYLENTNLMHLFADQKPNIGNLRETFFFNQLIQNHSITASKYGDFMIDENYTFEIGGPSKSTHQIKGVPNAYLALDINASSAKQIPLWLFGMFY